MNRPTIVVEPYRARVVRRRHAADPNAEPRVRVRWRARFADAVPFELSIDGCDSPDEALGRFVREYMATHETFDAALDAVALLFGTGRPPDVTLGRALRMAARNPHRKNPGCAVEVIDPAPGPGRVKGGAA